MAVHRDNFLYWNLLIEMPIIVPTFKLNSKNLSKILLLFLRNESKTTNKAEMWSNSLLSNNLLFYIFLWLADKTHDSLLRSFAGNFEERDFHLLRVSRWWHNWTDGFQSSLTDQRWHFKINFTNKVKAVDEDFPWWTTTSKLKT